MQKSAGQVTWRQIFNNFHLFNFSDFFFIVLRNINNSNLAKKSKKYFLRQKLKKITLL